MPAISWCEVTKAAERGHGPHCLVRLEVDGDTLVEGTVHAVAALDTAAASGGRVELPLLPVQRDVGRVVRGQVSEAAAG